MNYYLNKTMYPSPDRETDWFGRAGGGRGGVQVCFNLYTCLYHFVLIFYLYTYKYIYIYIHIQVCI